jgi:branched-chain amino acid transport system substrate-binding protein
VCAHQNFIILQRICDTGVTREFMGHMVLFYLNRPHLLVLFSPVRMCRENSSHFVIRRLAMGLHLKNFAAAGMVLLALCSLCGCQKNEPVRIGFVGGLTGRNGDLGTAGRDGAQLAVDSINAAGGVNGRKLELLVKDDKSDPEEGKRVVAELINAKVATIVGPMTSVIAAAVGPQVDSARILMLSPTVSSADFNNKDDFFFHLNLNHDTARSTAEYAFTVQDARSAALVYDISNKSYTASVAEGFKKRFMELGGAIVSDRTFNSKEKPDLLKLAQDVAGRRPDVIFIIAGALDSAMVCQQFRKLESPAIRFIAEWGGTNEFLKAGGNAVNGVYISQHFNSDSTHPPFVAFKSSFLQRFGDIPGFAATYSHESVSVIAEALKKNADLSRLKETLIAIRQFKGLQGEIVINNFGDPERSYSLMQVRDGRFVRVE